MARIRWEVSCGLHMGYVGRDYLYSVFQARLGWRAKRKHGATQPEALGDHATWQAARRACQDHFDKKEG